MKNVLFVGFKGKNNTSGVLAERLSLQHLLLTNSFAGLRRDIASLRGAYDCVVMFGVDKTLSSSVRIEKIASLNGTERASALDLQRLIEALADVGVPVEISDSPTAYLCNEAYWHMLDRFSGRAVFIHVPTLKHVDERFIEKMTCLNP
ncbi:MAG: hypothetical protein J5757_07945 [Lachnospiraceae bacterium]|nr:hypothetical protein [Lachnospiraceae bacterium]